MLGTLVVLTMVSLVGCGEPQPPAFVQDTPTRQAATQPAAATATTVAATATAASGHTAAPLPSATTVPAPAPTATSAPNGSALDGANLLAPLTKQTRLADTFVPPGLVDLPVPVAVRAGIRLRQAAADAVRALVQQATADGVTLAGVSGYRSYQEQDVLYRFYVQQMGAERAARISAQPGHSEHQMGTALDFGSPENGYQLEETFGATKAGVWMQQHAAAFGFVLSYPEGKEAVTGYAYEPWHYRYLGVDVAQKVAASGLTLTEYLRR